MALQHFLGVSSPRPQAQLALVGAALAAAYAPAACQRRSLVLAMFAWPACPPQLSLLMCEAEAVRQALVVALARDLLSSDCCGVLGRADTHALDAASSTPSVDRSHGRIAPSAGRRWPEGSSGLGDAGPAVAMRLRDLALGSPLAPMCAGLLWRRIWR